MKLQEADKIPLSKRLLNANFKLCCNLGIGAAPAGGKDLGITGMLKMKLSRHVTVMWINIWPETFTELISLPADPVVSVIKLR